MAFGTNRHDEENVMSEINVTPLVDVMLVLLVIFMLTLPALTHSISVDLPQTPETRVNPESEAIVVSVSRDGTVYRDGQMMDEIALENLFREAAKATPQPEIRLYGDRQAAYEHVISVMATAHRAGLQQLGFVTEPAP